MEPKPDRPPLIVIAGETASGKSAVALRLAERFDGEIICADSWTVRREVNIGTAKPTPEERRRVPHHLLDIVAPCADFSAAVFKQLANDAIDDIATRGRVPIMAGGTGLYIDSVLFDYTFLPAPPAGLRDELNSMTLPQLIERIHRQGLSLDGVDVRNKRRLIRLIESNGEQPTRQAMRQNTLVLGIKRQRDELRQRIIARVDQMISQGLEQEVVGLARVYGWGCEALKGVGYQEWRAYFAGEQDMPQTRQRIIRNSLNLAKRQRTWFNRNEAIRPICNFEESVDMVTTFLYK